MFISGQKTSHGKFQKLIACWFVSLESGVKGSQNYAGGGVGGVGEQGGVWQPEKATPKPSFPHWPPAHLTSQALMSDAGMRGLGYAHSKVYHGWTHPQNQRGLTVPLPQGLPTQWLSLCKRHPSRSLRGSEEAAIST